MHRLLSPLAFILFYSLPSLSANWAAPEFRPFFYSPNAQERRVEFTGYLRLPLIHLNQLEQLSSSEKKSIEQYELPQTLAFLFGPLTRRAIGGPQKSEKLQMMWDKPRMNRGYVEVPYLYQAQWILTDEVAKEKSLTLPLPYTLDAVYSPDWKKCTDSLPDHQTPSYYWYYWDPERWGCDHELEAHYQNIVVYILDASPESKLSYPEYKRMIRLTNHVETMALTFAFGYVKDRPDPNPHSDFDSGMAEYRAFIEQVEDLVGDSFNKSPILQGEYITATDPDKVIGQRFQGQKEGIEIIINVVASAGVDQMDLFAKSFAHDNDSFFAWFGHSRVGSGFDAAQLDRMLRTRPDYFQISPDYQIIYWGGCNSYSYYSLPFFEFKARAFPMMDPQGTRNLDILATGLPSYFSVNAENAMISLKHFLNFRQGPSYQQLIDELEASMDDFPFYALVTVLGDEDNPGTQIDRN